MLYALVFKSTYLEYMPITLNQKIVEYLLNYLKYIKKMENGPLNIYLFCNYLLFKIKPQHIVIRPYYICKSKEASLKKEIQKFILKSILSKKLFERNISFASLRLYLCPMYFK